MDEGRTTACDDHDRLTCARGWAARKLGGHLFPVAGIGSVVMRFPDLKWPLAAALALSVGGAASAAPLRVVNVASPDVLCVFNVSCHVTVTDSTGLFPPATGYTGHPKLYSRTFVAGPGAPAEGFTAYLYRVDFTRATAATDVNCAINLKVRFGDVARLKYDSGPRADVFVISTGGAGDIGLTSAVKLGPVVTLTFATEVCPQGGFTSARSSFYIGMASKGAPVASVAKSDLTFGGGTVRVKARTPQLP